MNKEARILVTGAKGFVGKSLCCKLREKDYKNVFSFESSVYNLKVEQEVKKLFEENERFEVVIHLASIVKGIKFRKEKPASIFYDNLMMNTLIQEYALRNKVSKFIGLGSVVVYSEDSKMPFEEVDYLKGEPEETNYSYSIAKRAMLQQGKAYRKQYGFNSVHLIMANMYGPGFEVDSDELYVIPSLIKRFAEAKEKTLQQVVVWGSGKACREFLYIDDASEAIILAMEKYNEPEPLNIGTGVETPIKELAEKISKLIKYKGEIIWDTTKPEGKLRNVSNVIKAMKLIGFKARTNLEEGLRKTIEYYEGKKIF